MFNYSEKSSYRYDYHTPVEQINTTIGRALSELNCAFLHHSPGNPRAKGKIERHFQFFQDWFVVQHRGVEIPKDKEKVTLHIHPQKKIRVWYRGKFVKELPW